MEDLRESYVLYEQHQNAQKEKDEAQGKKAVEVWPHPCRGEGEGRAAAHAL